MSSLIKYACEHYDQECSYVVDTTSLNDLINTYKRCDIRINFDSDKTFPPCRYHSDRLVYSSGFIKEFEFVKNKNYKIERKVYLDANPYLGEASITVNIDNEKELITVIDNFTCKLHKDFTLQEFINEILKYDFYGLIIILNKDEKIQLSYKDHKLLSPLNKYQNEKINNTFKYNFFEPMCDYIIEVGNSGLIDNVNKHNIYAINTNIKSSNEWENQF